MKVVILAGRRIHPTGHTGVKGSRKQITVYCAGSR